MISPRISPNSLVDVSLVFYVATMMPIHSTSVWSTPTPASDTPKTFDPLLGEELFLYQASKNTEDSSSQSSSCPEEANIEESETGIYTHRRTDFVWLEHNSRCRRGRKIITCFANQSERRKKAKIERFWSEEKNSANQRWDWVSWRK